MNTINRTLSIAPMMDWSDHHCRYFWRLLTRQALLYTEMVTTGALIHGDRERFLHFSAQEHPLALQLGGSNPAIWQPPILKARSCCGIRRVFRLCRIGDPMAADTRKS
jgi:tRNA-dihydrouridine synthase